MTENEVYEQVLNNITHKTWGKGSFTWSDGSPRCIMGHLNNVIYGHATGVAGGIVDLPDLVERRRLMKVIELRLNKLVPSYGGLIGWNDGQATYAQVRILIQKAYHATKPTVKSPPPTKRRSLIDRLFNPLPASVTAHEFNLKE